MKKYLFLASAATLLLASCSDEFNPGNNNQEIQGKSVIYASMPDAGSNVTRTYVEPTASGTYRYYWDQGDQIGLYGTNVENASYINVSQSGSDAKFVGQTNLKAGGTYFGYYPYSEDQSFTPVQNNGTYTSASLNVNIKAKQNFNYTMAYIEDENNNVTPSASGSFSQSSAPAVAIATAEKDNELNFSLEPMASYMRVPFTGVGSIYSIALTVANSDTYLYQLNGYQNIDLLDEDAVDAGLSFPANVNRSVSASEAEATITLYCADGAELNPTNPVWFWFVIPTGIDLNDATATMVVNGSLGSATFTKSFGDLSEMDGYTAQNGYPTVRNTPYDITNKQNATNKSFVYSGTDNCLLTTPAQFLEYANLVTVGAETAIKNYNTLTEGQIKYSYLPQMLKGGVVPTDENASFASVLNAVIPVDITITEDIVETLLGGNGDGILGAGGSPLYFEYLQNYLGGKFKTIGTGSEFTMQGIQFTNEEGNQVCPTVSGLPILGNSLFNSIPAGSQTPIAFTVKNLIFDNVTITPTNANSAYFLSFNLGQQGRNYDNFTVGANCSLEGVETPTLFNQIYASLFDYSDVVNNSTMGWAVTLSANDNFDFTKLQGTSTKYFENISITKQKYPILTVFAGTSEDAEEAAVESLNNAKNVIDIVKETMGTNYGNDYAYSVVAGDTSYWTGTLYMNNSDNNDYVMAEEFANYVQYFRTYFTLDLTHNLDLMNLPWFTAPDRPADQVVTINGNDKTISNVSINPVAGATNLSLLGLSSIVTNLTVSDLTIDNTGDNAIEAYVAGLSVWPGVVNGTNGVEVSTKNVTLNNITIKATQANADLIGGFYVSLGRGQIESITDLNITGTTVIETQVQAGYIAGLLSYTLNTPTGTLSDPVVTNFDASSLSVPEFAIAGINVVAQSELTPELTITGFTQDYVLKIPVTLVNSNGEITEASEMYQMNLLYGNSGWVYQCQKNQSTFSRIATLD